MAQEGQEAKGAGTVTLIVPAVPENVGIVRLTILGVASRMGFTYDQAEDIRLAVGEACTNAIERSANRNGVGGDSPMITIRCHAEVSRLTIEVEDEGGGPAPTIDVTDSKQNIADMDNAEIGALLMEILVDEVEVEALDGGGTRVRLVKDVAGA